MNESEQRYGANSPMDDNPTNALQRPKEPSEHTEGEITTTTETVTTVQTADPELDTSPDTEPLSPVSPDISNTNYQYASRVELFDPSLLEIRAAREELLVHEYTADEIAKLKPSDDPNIIKLAETRAVYDAEASRRIPLFMSRTDRATRQAELLTAREAFDNAREAYISSLAGNQSDVSALAQLTAARVDYVEAGFAVRQGKLLSRAKDKRAFEKARLVYESSRAAYISEVYDTYAKGPVPDAMAPDAFLVALNDREQGALAGEEANYYISEINDEDKKSRFQKLTERYNKMNRWQKIATGVGVAALAGVGFGAIGGAAAIGGVVGVKFSRNYLSGEAERRKGLMDRRTQEENSVLYAGNAQESSEQLALLQDAAPETRAGIQSDIMSKLDKHSEAVLNEGDRTSKDKRKVIGKAGLIAAAPIVGGAAVGAVLEHYFPALSHGLFREKGLLDLRSDTPQGGNIDGPDSSSVPDSPSVPDTTPGVDTPPSPDSAPDINTPSSPDTAPDTSSSPDLSPPSAESTYLYGDFAGTDLTIDIPSGSTIWEEVGNSITHDNPYLSYSERERLTGNIVNKLLAQQPWIDPRSLAAGTRLNVNIPS